MKTAWHQGPWELYEGGNFLIVGRPGYINNARGKHLLGASSGAICRMEFAYGMTPRKSTRLFKTAELITLAPDMAELLLNRDMIPHCQERRLMEKLREIESK